MRYLHKYFLYFNLGHNMPTITGICKSLGKPAKVSDYSVALLVK